MTRPFTGSLVGNVWRVWAEHWSERGETIPPLHHLHDGAGEDAFFVVALSVSELASAMRVLSNNSSLRFTPQGSWALPSTSWFGHWSVFSAAPRVLDAGGFGR